MNVIKKETNNELFTALIVINLLYVIYIYYCLIHPVHHYNFSHAYTAGTKFHVSEMMSFLTYQPVVSLRVNK